MAFGIVQPVGKCRQSLIKIIATAKWSVAGAGESGSPKLAQPCVWSDRRCDSGERESNWKGNSITQASDRGKLWALLCTNFDHKLQVRTEV